MDIPSTTPIDLSSPAVAAQARVLPGSIMKWFALTALVLATLAIPTLVFSFVG